MLTKFIKDNMMPWPQYFDGLGQSNKFSIEFSITGIPATFLIGTDGKIVATNLRGNALVSAIEKQLGK